MIPPLDVIRVDKGTDMLSITRRLMSTKVTVVVDAPVEEVFAFVADVRNLDGWFLNGTIRRTSGRGTEVDSSFTYTFVAGTSQGTRRLTIVEAVATSRFAYDQAETGGAEGLVNRFLYELQPADPGTRITYSVWPVQSDLSHDLIVIVLLPLVLPLWLLGRPLWDWYLRRKLRRIDSLL